MWRFERKTKKTIFDCMSITLSASCYAASISDLRQLKPSLKKGICVVGSHSNREYIVNRKGETRRIIK